MASGSAGLPGSGSKRAKCRDPLVVGQGVEPDAARRAVVAEAQARLRELGRPHRIGKAFTELGNAGLGPIERRDRHGPQDQGSRSLEQAGLGRHASGSRHVLTGSSSILAELEGLQAVIRRLTLDFLKTEAAAGAMLAFAAALALLAANSPFAGDYQRLLSVQLPVPIGGFRHVADFATWVREGLMTLFFFVVGLDIKFEALRGELSNRRQLALPLVSALGGMAVPALVYTSVNLHPAATCAAGRRRWRPTSPSRSPP